MPLWKLLSCTQTYRIWSTRVIGSSHWKQVLQQTCRHQLETDFSPMWAYWPLHSKAARSPLWIFKKLLLIHSQISLLNGQARCTLDDHTFSENNKWKWNTSTQVWRIVLTWMVESYLFYTWLVEHPKIKKKKSSLTIYFYTCVTIFNALPTHLLPEYK